MTLTEILDKKSTTEEKLEEVKKLVDKTRKSYGNEDSTIEVPVVPTVSGVTPFNMLEANSQLHFVTKAVNDMKMMAMEAENDIKGLNVEKYVEMLIATDPTLASVGVPSGLGLL